MGWFNDQHPGHEGYVVAVIETPKRSGLYREVTISAGWKSKKPIPRGKIRYVHVACDCGWRSPRLLAPLGTEWFPSCCDLNDEGAEDAAREIWRSHIEEDCVFNKVLSKFLIDAVVSRRTA